MNVSFVQDAFSRRILGFVVAASKGVELVTRTLLQAVNVRERSSATFVADGVIVHSDAGSQYTSLAFTEKLLELGLAASIGRVGTALAGAALVPLLPGRNRLRLSDCPYQYLAVLVVLVVAA